MGELVCPIRFSFLTPLSAVYEEFLQRDLAHVKWCWQRLVGR
jgi:hypothetical protein